MEIVRKLIEAGMPISTGRLERKIPIRIKCTRLATGAIWSEAERHKSPRFSPIKVGDELLPSDVHEGQILEKPVAFLVGDGGQVVETESAVEAKVDAKTSIEIAKSNALSIFKQILKEMPEAKTAIFEYGYTKQGVSKIDASTMIVSI